MSNVPDLEAKMASALLVERRRPGRPANVSEELIPLLRGEVNLPPEQDRQFGHPDELRGAKGLAAGLVVSAVLWAGIICLARWIF